MTHDETCLSKITEALRDYSQGLKQAELARLLDTHPETIARAMVELNRRGILLQEDPHGRISLFNQKNHVFR